MMRFFLTMIMIFTINPLRAHFEDDVKAHIAKDFHGQDLSIVFDYPEILSQLPSQPEIMAYKMLDQSRIQLTVKDMTKPITAQVKIMVDVPALNKPLSPSHIIQAEDITMIKVPMTSLNGHYALRTDDLLGKQSKQKVLGALTPLQTTDLMAPLVIKRDSFVRVLYRAGNLTISAQAKALKDGAIGQRIMLETTGKVKKVIEAIVMDSNTVEMQAT